MPMKSDLGEYGIEEAAGVTAFLLSLLFIRLLRATNEFGKLTFIVFGIPPWRDLRVSDLHDKRSIGWE